jgi:DNA-binding transcriptional LysR family regulator
MRRTLDTGLFHAMQLFIRVADARSMTAAAAQSDLTTAQVSRMVTELERRLETKLIQRNSRHLTLTAAGENYLPKCRAALDLVAAAEGEAAGTAEQPVGNLRVMCLSGFGKRYVVPLISEYLRRYPNAQIDYLTRQGAPDVLGEGVDVGLFVARELNSSSLIAKRVGSFCAHMCASPGYVAAHNRLEHPADLAGHRCLRVVNASISHQWDLTDGRSSYTLRADGPLTADSPEALVDAARRGFGIALVPSYAIVDSLQDGALVKVLPTWRSEHFGVFAVMPSRQFVTAKTRAWLDLVEERLPGALERDEHLFNSCGLSGG